MRRSRHITAAAVAAAAILLLGACGGSSDGDSGLSGGTASDTGDSGGESGGESGGGTQDTGSGGTPASESDFDGTWTTGLTPPYNVLVFTQGTVAFSTDDSSEVCTGTVSGDALDLVCTTGSNDWREGTVSLAGDTLTVSWDSGTEETYERLAGSLSDLGLEDLESSTY